MMLSKKKFALVSAAVILAGTICFTVFRFVIPGLSDMRAAPEAHRHNRARNARWPWQTQMTSRQELRPSKTGPLSPFFTQTINEIDKPFDLTGGCGWQGGGTDSGYFKARKH